MLTEDLFVYCQIYPIQIYRFKAFSYLTMKIVVHYTT
jgi:hypothetical protein